MTSNLDRLTVNAEAKAHRDDMAGVVDALHLKRYPKSSAVLGQRVTVSLADARDAIRCGQRLLDVT